jgi:structural maintenance of chromosome 1
LTYLQTKRSHQQITDEIARLQVIVDSAEDGIFANFCRKIRVTNIREYEDRQLKASQDEMDARLRYDTQIARLTHQYAILSLSIGRS